MSDTTIPAATWNVDPAHSEVAFTVRHLMSKVRGTFADFTGTITTAGDDLSAASVTATVEMASVSTHNETRDGHLKSTEIFNAEANPQMTFTSTKITPNGDDWVITGDLTINGVTRSVDFAAEFLGVDLDPWGGTRLGVEAKTQIVRKDFGVDFNIPLDGGKLLIGDKVDVSLAVEAVKA